MFIDIESLIMSVIMTYDLETIPDVALGRRVLNLPESIDEKTVVEALSKRRLEQTQGSSTFLPHYLHRIVAISVVVRSAEWVKVWSLGDLDAEESEIIERFFEGIQRYKPTLVSWNGSGFDLPVLHYRALKHGISAPLYWENGDRHSEFRWNNYLSRYHHRHTDLMDVLASYSARAYAPLDEIALMLGLPGKMDMHGSIVLEKFQQGELDSIRNYCESDVLNTYLIFLKYELIRGILDKEAFESEEDRLKLYLLNSGKPHLVSFLKKWQKTAESEVHQP